ncbi:DUF1592 domain-containing protein [Marinagarivorans algicola]|uniref:DUF1592 domain-containing protein n=1 Tax=Marinagarivorans algicola TaxID=1513270 RepID=UPI0006B6317F|nr:DUF1592 domain-containing protein [Marinagarivorans algicola]
MGELTRFKVFGIGNQVGHMAQRTLLPAVFMASVLLSACGGQTEPKSSSPAVSSAPVQSSSIASSKSSVSPLSSMGQSSSAAPTQGKALYDAQCGFCHGPTGLGKSLNPNLLPSIKNGTFDHATVTRMPPQDFDACKADCADQIKTWLIDTHSITDVGMASSSVSSSAGNNQPAEPDDRYVSVIAINVGGGNVISKGGVNFAADNGSTGGDTSNQESVVADVGNTKDDALFHTERWGAFSYSFALPNGYYNIELGFVELVSTHKAGSRVFNVALEGDVKLERVDVAGEAGGHYKALIKEVANVQVQDGMLNIDFQKVTHNPTVSFINIKRAENVADQYGRLCQSCHGGPNGEGRSELGDALIASRCTSCANRDGLVNYISALMPFQFPTSCQGECAANMADYILENFAGYNTNPAVTLPDFLQKGGDAGACNQVNVAFNDMRRIGQVDYNRMVFDLFKLEGDFSRGFSADQLVGNFYINTSRTPEFSQVSQYFAVAEKVSTQALATKAQWMPCTQTNDACATKVIDTIGRKAYRRPVTAQEKEGLMQIYTAAKAAGGFDRGLATLLQGLLASPQFLYYVEEGVGQGDIVPLSQYEIAARLALFFWRSLPDDTLLDLAEQNALTTDAQLRTQAQRMLNDPRARDVVGLFHREWMKVTPPKPGTADHAAQSAAVEDFSRTLQSLVFDDKATFKSLFTVDYGYLNADTKSFYGVNSQPLSTGGGGFDKYAMAGDKRIGLLTRAPFLRSNHTPTERGLFLREQVLCGVIPSPPATAADAEQAMADNLNPRELFALHTQDPGCGGCHALMDPLGFPLDNYDEEGHWQDQYGDGFSVDASGEFILTDVDGAFSGGQALQAKLASSQQVKECYTYQWYQFAVGRSATPSDTCSLGQVNTAADASGGSVLDVMTSIVLSDGFRHRRTAP